jgi:hypothetical protein
MREGRGLRHRVRGQRIADPGPSRRIRILLDPPGYLNGLLTPWRAQLRTTRHRKCSVGLARHEQESHPLILGGGIKGGRLSERSI